MDVKRERGPALPILGVLLTVTMVAISRSWIDDLVLSSRIVSPVT